MNSDDVRHESNSGTHDPYGFDSLLNEPSFESRFSGSWQDVAPESERLNLSDSQNGAQEHLAPEIQIPEKSSREKAEDFVRRNQTEFDHFAHGYNIKYEPSATAKTFAFYPKEMKIEMPVSWFEGDDYSEDELKFTNYHELSHFMDMRKNPEAFIDNFDGMRADAKRYAVEYLKSHPEDTHSESSVADFYYDQLHLLYNCLDDIYVNNVVRNRNHYYVYRDGRASVMSLYEKLGFKDSDLRGAPLHEQFAYSLLRDEMISEEHGNSILDEEVESILSYKKKYQIKTFRQEILDHVRPERSALVNPEDRYAYIRGHVQQKYVDLINVSLDDESQQQNLGQQSSGSTSQSGDTSAEDDQQNSSQQSSGSISQSGDTSAVDDSFDPFAGRHLPINNDHLDKWEDSDETIRDMLNSFLEDKTAGMSRDELAKFNEHRQERRFDRSNGITQEERRENREIQAAIREPRREMRRFWENLIGRSIEYRNHTRRNQLRGHVNVRGYINRYADIQSGNLKNLDIYERKVEERELVDQPETIDISLVIDCSGSMCDKDKITKNAAALLLYSVKDFNDALDAKRNITKSKLRANTEVILFGDDMEVTKKFDRTASREHATASIIKAVSGINSEMGGTSNYEPLKHIEDEMTPTDKTKIKAKKLKKIIFNITDGEEYDFGGQIKKVIQELSQDGVILVSFRIGDIEEFGAATFNELWNQDDKAAKNAHGIIIGENIASLPRKLMESLKDALGDIVI